MSESILRGTWSTADAAFAVQHPSFGNFERELNRTNALVLPRRRTPGPGGGNYRFAHIVERAFAVTIGANRSRAMASCAFWGLLNVLGGNDYALKKINALPAADRKAVMLHQPDFEPEDYPAHAPHDLVQAVEFPVFYFGDDFISRDPKKPTFFIFDPAAHAGAPAAGFLVGGEVKLSAAHQRLVDLKLAQAGSEQAAEVFREECDDVPMLNLTAMLNRIEERLALRLKAREIRGA